jgi:hypothetical protein
MVDDESRDPGALVGIDEAAELLEVARDRVPVMVEEGLLTPVDEEGVDGPRFRRAEVIALSELGG